MRSLSSLLVGVALAVAAPCAFAQERPAPAAGAAGGALGSGVVFGLDGRYFQFSRPSAPLSTQYPFAARASRLPTGDSVGGVGFGADLRWRFKSGWVLPIVSIAMAHSEAARRWIAPDGTAITHDGIDLYDVGLPGIGYRVEARSWVIEGVVRPTFGAVDDNTLHVVGTRGRFDGSALAPIHAGARAELDVCTPPAGLGQLRFRPCALASPAYVAGGDGSNLSFGLRLELFARSQ
jgi:hypothetical protein